MRKTKIEMERHSNVFLSLHVSDNCIKDLLNLDTLGIKDSLERRTEIELVETAKDHFTRHVSRDADGRYVVSLPWIQDHPFLSNCRNLAERRLKNCVRSLERSKNLGKYESFSLSWLDEGIFVEVLNDADQKNEHYLSHYRIYKNIPSTKIRPEFDGLANEKNTQCTNE